MIFRTNLGFKVDGEKNKKLIELANDTEYMDYHYYSGELGAIYHSDYTEFKLWAPTASQVELVIYDGYYGNVKTAYLMEKDAKKSVFKYRIEGDCHGLTYRYRLVFLDGSVNMSVDPYSKATTVNGQRSVVVDLARTNPNNWGERMEPFEDLSQAVIYEVHVRDLTVSDTSGVVNKGKYIGAAETGTVNAFGSSTGLDYIKNLGVTHVEFLPLFDYQTVDETWEEPREYNWGYDPLNYNVPEGSYSTNAYDPFARIKELKTMIQAYHDAGLRVIMDVVYNHVYEVENHSFHKTVPGYYFRMDEDGNYKNSTGVGNETYSERLMMRKYIVDSVVYWAKEYHIDGFRFDLMGIHDVETMQQVRHALDKIDPSIIILGEGWDMYQPQDGGYAANFNNAAKMPRISQFNAGLRESLKGNDFDVKSRGFINGAWYMEGQLANNFRGGVDYGLLDNPLQLIQYVEAHDNHTLHDRLRLTDPYRDEEILVSQQELAMTITLLAHGIPFIHAGQEFLRSKNLERNSYNSSDEINQIDWLRQERYARTVNLVKDLIALRKQEKLFRLKTFDEINKHSEVIRADYQILHVHYKCDDYTLEVIFNAQDNVLNVPLDSGDYFVKLMNGRVYLVDEQIIRVSDTVPVQPYSALVLKK